MGRSAAVKETDSVANESNKVIVYLKYAVTSKNKPILAEDENNNYANNSQIQ